MRRAETATRSHALMKCFAVVVFCPLVIFWWQRLVGENELEGNAVFW